MKWLAAAAFLALAACDSGQRSNEAPAMDMAVAAAPPAPAMEQAASRSVANAAGGVAKIVDEDQAAGGGGGGDPAIPSEARQIAYTYQYGFAVPTGNLEGLFNAHKAACESAGPAKCYIVNSNISGLGQDSASGYVQLKASADWINSFKAGLDKSLEPFGATLDSSNTSAEDLTTQIIDTSATLNSRKTLRERLQKLLAERPGKLSELLDIERELARVQQEIDSTESILAAMKLRVAMSDVTFNYQPKYTAASQSIWRPLGAAVDNFLPNLIESVAGILNFISGMLIWLILLGLVILLFLARRGRRSKRAPPTAAAPPPPAV